MACDKQFRRVGPPPGIRGRLAEALELEPESLHEIDLGDVALDDRALYSLGRTAKRAIHRKVPFHVPVSGPFGDLMGSLHRRAYWNEEGGQLVLSVEVLGRIHLVVVPCGQWRLKHITWN